jgi:copper transport protein
LKKFLIPLSLLFIGILPVAYAHPLILDSDPAQSATIPAGITHIVIHYSEAIEIDFSYIKVLDSNGNQIDNKDTKYFDTESSLVVTTPPLEDGIYTVTSKVLSKVDGHLVDDAFSFGVGNVSVPPPKQKDVTGTIYFPEAGARFPGLVGQVIVLGSVISSLVLWKTIQRKSFVKENFVELQKFYHTKFFSIIGIALFSVFASNILMLLVQTIRLQTTASNVLQTSFGSVWIARMAITVILLAVWFLMENKSSLSSKKQWFILGLSLLLIGTTTIIGHGTATEQLSPVIIDYIHNLIASIWIGGVIFFGFILLPSLTKLNGNKKELAVLSLIPQFSSMVIVTLGVLIITGPILLWFLEDDIALLSQSYYGLLIITKIIIASGMVALGAYNQFKIQRPAQVALKSNDIIVHKKLKRTLKTEAILGIILLGVVALLTNSSLPASQSQQATAQEISHGLQTEAFSNNARFDVDVKPFRNGENTVFVSVLDSDGNPLDDLSGIKMKISNLEKNISPIEIPLALTGSEKQSKYEGKITFGFSGKWNVEIVAQRTQHVNDVVNFAVFVKPHISELKTNITEFVLPDNAAPLYPEYDGNDTIWISDASNPRLWKFSISEKKFTGYKFEGKATVFLKLDNDGKVWFADTPDGKIGYFEPVMEKFTLMPLPTKSIPISLETDLHDNIWIALVDQHSLLKYDQAAKRFEEHKIPTIPSGPAALKRDVDGNIWFVESQSGKIGMINPQTGNIQEFMPDKPLKEPSALFIDDTGNIWISEHVGLDLVKFNPVLQTFEPVAHVTDPNSLPFGITSDKFGNIWFAQHIADNLGVYDPHKNEFFEVPIPTKSTFTQFITADKDGNIWFVEQRTNKLGNVIISEGPVVNSIQEQAKTKIRYSDFAAPFISIGIIATSLFFVKSVHDRRKIDSLIE